MCLWWKVHNPTYEVIQPKHQAESDQVPMCNYQCTENKEKQIKWQWRFNPQTADYEKLCKANNPISLTNKLEEQEEEKRKNLKEFIPNRTVLQDILKEILQRERRYYQIGTWVYSKEWRVSKMAKHGV